MPSPLDDVLGFFDHLGSVEKEVYSGLLVDELDMMDEIKLRKKLKPLFDGKPDTFITLPQRPAAPKPDWLEKARAKDTGKRTVYAVQVAEAGGDTVVLVYCDEYVKNSLEMWNRFAVGFVGEFLKVVAREVRCGDCGGTGCGTCKQRGWRNAGGDDLGKVTVRETRKLTAPKDDAASQALYEALS